MPELILPNIDYNKWLDRAREGGNLENSGRGSHTQMLTMLNNKFKPEKGSLLWGILNDKAQLKQSMNDLVKIAKKIANQIHNDPKTRSVYYKPKNKINEAGKKSPYTEDDFYLAIFDLIQSWGGASQGGTGVYNAISKGTYKPNIPVRETPSEWLPKYKEAISILKNPGSTKEDQERAILKAEKIFRDINHLGKSYGTKHLWFWTEFFYEKGTLEDTAGVSDKRTDILIFGESTTEYEESLKVYNKIKEKYNLENFSSRDVEKALFAFSKNYFNVPMTTMYTTEGEDSEEALRIYKIREEERKNGKSSNASPRETAEEKAEREEQEKAEREEQERLRGIEMVRREKERKEQARLNKINKAAEDHLSKLQRSLERKAEDEVVPEEILKGLRSFETSTNKKNQLRKKKDEYTQKITDKFRELRDQEKKKFMDSYKEEENQINETWNKWVKWATQ
jgi:hypothetical protein